MFLISVSFAGGNFIDISVEFRSIPRKVKYRLLGHPPFPSQEGGQACYKRTFSFVRLSWHSLEFGVPAVRKSSR